MTAEQFIEANQRVLPMIQDIKRLERYVADPEKVTIGIPDAIQYSRYGSEDDVTKLFKTELEQSVNDAWLLFAHSELDRLRAEVETILNTL